MIQITPSIALDEKEIHEEFIRASGPGGQNVNKVATAVQLRFNVRHSLSLPDNVRARLMRLARRRVNAFKRWTKFLWETMRADEKTLKPTEKFLKSPHSRKG